MDNRPAALRTMRAWINLNQADAAAAIGVSKRLLVDAELGVVLTDKTWLKAVAFYESRGVYWRTAGSVSMLMLSDPLDQHDADEPKAG